VKIKRIGYLLLLLSGLAQAAPDLNVGAMYDYMADGRSTMLKRIRNGGDVTAFVKVSVAELVYNDKGEPTEIPLEGMAMEQRGLVVSPARLIVPANGMQSVRLLYRGERDKERLYRLRFIPVLPEANDGFALDKGEVASYRESMSAGVQVMTGYGTVLFVRPSQPRFDTQVKRHNGELVATNNGNTTVVMDHFRQCAKEDQDCDNATMVHVMPGRTRQFEGQADKVHQFELIEGSAKKTMVVGG